jgi:hypothetical protein
MNEEHPDRESGFVVRVFDLAENPRGREDVAPGDAWLPWLG